MFDLFQPSHLLIVLLVAFLVFGPKKLPELGAGLGKGIREFKRAMSEINKEVAKPLTEEKAPVAQAPANQAPADHS